MEEIERYFPGISQKQQLQFAALFELYSDWNAKINVISRKDMDNFYIHHVLHSLGIAKVIQFNAGARILDVGTGGGFPGIPLAIMFPETQFLLVDSIGKKIKVVKEVALAIGLHNVEANQCRAEEVKGKFHFVVSRAVTALPEFLNWINLKIVHENSHSLNNGVLYLKGGDLTDELMPVKKSIKIFDLKEFFAEDFFDTKKVVHIDLSI